MSKVIFEFNGKHERDGDEDRELMQHVRSADLAYVLFEFEEILHRACRGKLQQRDPKILLGGDEEDALTLSAVETLRGHLRRMIEDYNLDDCRPV